jgi:hypothetical protein
VLKTVAAPRNQPEADLMVERLAAAGIRALSQLASGNPEFGASGTRWIYVEERDEARARELLEAEEPPFTDEELAELSERAAREARDR